MRKKVLENKKLKGIVDKVQKETGYTFCEEDLKIVAEYTQRKCDLNHKEKWYFPLLFEDELRSWVASYVISIRSERNMLARCV